RARYRPRSSGVRRRAATLTPMSSYGHPVRWGIATSRTRISARGSARPRRPRGGRARPRDPEKKTSSLIRRAPRMSPVRKISTLAVLTALSGTLLVGCASAPAASTASCFTETGSTAALVEAKGAFGAAPQLDFPKPLRPKETSRAELLQGDG